MAVGGMVTSVRTTPQSISYSIHSKYFASGSRSQQITRRNKTVLPYACYIRLSDDSTCRRAAAFWCFTRGVLLQQSMELSVGHSWQAALSVVENLFFSGVSTHNNPLAKVKLSIE
eukprot:GHVQ01001934.1.p2 GENE.GHVQ01001934.1~~GHVQ01001934.1.p2  ORF type:complete len:115 (-),score=11.75 GHVQ01001934.1:592-936(-)